jgi:hypothetical protein
MPIIPIIGVMGILVKDARHSNAGANLNAQ